MTITFRLETESDYTQITEVIDQAFDGRPYADGDESEVVLRLRDQGGLALGLIAEKEGEFVAHAAFSPVIRSDGGGNWYALGPIAVYPKIQSEGIGGKLIEEGLKRIREIGGQGCMLTGNPDYYRRFGFDFSPDNCPEQEPAEYFMVKCLSDDPLPTGPMSFHPAFYG